MWKRYVLQNVDTARLARMITWGGAFAPLAHVWYGQLDKFITGKGTAAVVQKVAADQVRRLYMREVKGWSVCGHPAAVPRD